MPVIARDAVASDHLVYAWPFPIGPEEYEVACSDDEQVVMCPSWLVGDRLGPGRHRWRTQDPMRPVSAYFVLTAPVEVSFDMTTSFVIPTTGLPVRLRATGSLQVRCADPGLLIAQFVGLPFDAVNDGILRSVTRSVERMLARLLTRRVVMANTPAAVTDPAMMQHIIEELIAYNPAAGAVFGVELMRMGHLSILADDGSQPWQEDGRTVETARLPVQNSVRATVPRAASPTEASGEFVVRPMPTTPPPIPGRPVMQRRASAIEIPETADDVTQPGIQAMSTPVPGALLMTPVPASAESQESRGSILGIGVAHIGSSTDGTRSRPSAPPKGGAVQSSVASGEITRKIAPGARVLVAGPNGLMQSATVRQLLQGYYELEIGGSGETIWVPINGVVPE